MSTSSDRMRRLRERRAAEQAAALSPVPDAAPRDPDELLEPAVEAAVGALRLGERDLGAVQLARVLARAIDEAADRATALRVLGPQLAKAIEALGGTPASRARQGRGEPRRPERPNAIAQLRAAHLASPAKRKRLGA